MTLLLLIRHGENDYFKHRLAGQLPGIHLNDEGKQQAIKLVQRLEGIPVKAIYSSPLERATETAAPLAEARKLPVQVRQGLIELDYGKWGGKTYKQIKRAKLWNLVLTRPSEARFPGGESLVEVRDRTVLEIQNIARCHPGDDIVACFSHGDTIRLAITYFLNMQLDDFHRLQIHTTAISVLRLDEKMPPVFLNINQTDVLKL